MTQHLRHRARYLRWWLQYQRMSICFAILMGFSLSALAQQIQFAPEKPEYRLRDEALASRLDAEEARIKRIEDVKPDAIQADLRTLTKQMETQQMTLWGIVVALAYQFLTGRGAKPTLKKVSDDE